MKDAIILVLLFIIGLQVALYAPHDEPVAEPIQASSLMLTTNGWLNMSGAWIYMAEDGYDLNDACWTFIDNGYVDYTVISWQQLRNGIVVENYPRLGL